MERAVRLPLAAPAEIGVKVTLTVRFWPTPRVAGRDSGVSEKPVPLTATCEIVTLDPPLFVIRTESGRDAPTVTFPKLRLLGLGVNCPGPAALPESGTFKVAFEALLVMVKLPVTLPADCGVNVTVKVVL